MTTLGLRIDPLDPLLFRDGRPFDAASRVTGGLPNPQVLAGALRTAMLARMPGFSLAKFAAARKGRASIEDSLIKHGGAPGWWMNVRFRGPWVALVQKDKPIEPLLPLPQIVYFPRNGKPTPTARLRPNKHPMSGWDGSTPNPLWADHDRDSKRDRDWIRLSELAAVLNNHLHSPRPEFLVPEKLAVDADIRVGIEINPHTFTVEEGALYGVQFQAMNRKLPSDHPWAADAEVAYYAEVILPDEAKAEWFTDPTPVPFGGEGRYAGVRQVTAVEWPKPPQKTGPQWVYLASPAFLPGDSPLPKLDGAKLLAAASGPGVAVSGWDVARNGPRPTRFAVPAGACYFYDGTPEMPDDSIDPELSNRLEGWGYALRGSWDW